MALVMVEKDGQQRKEEKEGEEHHWFSFECGYGINDSSFVPQASSTTAPAAHQLPSSFVKRAFFFSLSLSRLFTARPAFTVITASSSSSSSSLEKNPISALDKNFFFFFVRLSVRKARVIVVKTNNLWGKRRKRKKWRREGLFYDEERLINNVHKHVVGPRKGELSKLVFIAKYDGLWNHKL